MKKRKGLVICLVIAGLVCTAAGLYAGYTIQNSRKSITQKDASVSESTGSESSSYMKVTYNGTEYEYNTNLKNVLFIGVDKTDLIGEKTPGKAGQADCLILLSMDTKTKETKMLEISRDSMTEIKIYGTEGGLVGTEKAQLAAQYAYGDGKARSCQLTKEAVSRVLYGIPINSYFALDISGISPIIDAIGGLPVTLDEDWSWIDPAFTAGAELSLTGAQATSFVRSRNTAVLDSNNDRMIRQGVFLKALISQVKAKAGNNSGIYDLMLHAADGYLVTDMQDKEIHSLATYSFNNEIETVPGDVVMGEKYAEFNVNRTELYKIILKLLYKSAETG